MSSTLVVSKDRSAYQTIIDCLDKKAIHASSREEALLKLGRKRHDFIFIDVDLLRDTPAENNFKASLRQFRHLFPSIEIIVMSSQDKIRDTVTAVKEGASDYLTYPLAVAEIKYVVESINDSKIVKSELDYLRDAFWKKETQDIISTQSTAMNEVFEKIRAVAPTISTVLLVGETGTGKGVLAKTIHNHSKRSNAQFISVHCGAIPDTLIESELFGHEKGAFTGALRRKLGKFEIAKDGTIFLDEVATLTGPAQIKLLQILQDKIFQRVGGEQILRANVRIIAATNMDLKAMSDAGLFRKDLFYRLNVFPIEIPPLRERKEDIPAFVELFLNRLNQFHSKEIHAIDPGILEVFATYSWPGNIRELENLIERAYILEKSSTLTRTSFPIELFRSENFRDRLFPDTSLSLAEMHRASLEQLDRIYLEELLSKNGGKINQTAAIAKISSRYLHKLMKKHGLRKENFKK